jgi:hypothetical protein
LAGHAGDGIGIVDELGNLRGARPIKLVLGDYLIFI